MADIAGPERPVPRAGAGVPRAIDVPPALVVAAALLGTSLVGRFVADGRIKYGLGIVLAACFAPLVFFNFPAALGVWVAVQFFAQLSALSYGPNGMSILIGLGWLGTFLGRRHPLALMRQHRQVLLLIAGFCLWITLSIGWAKNPADAGTEAAYWWMAAFAFLIVVTTIQTPDNILRIVLAFVLGAIIAVIIGLATGGLATATASTQTAIQGRLTGGGGDPNQQAAGFVAAMFLVVGLFSVYTSRRARRWLMLGFALISVGFFATQSRGGLIGLAVATVAALVLSPHQRRRILSLAALVGGAAGLLVVLHPSSVSRITDLSGGTSGRSDLWRVAWEVFGGHPFAGVGIGNFVVVEAQSHYVLRPGSISRIQYLVETPQIVHNTYLQLLAETGVVGLLGFLAAVGASLWAGVLACRRFEAAGRRDYADLARAVLMGAIGMLTAIFFISDGNDTRLWVLLALGPALLGIARRTSAAPNRTKGRRLRGSGFRFSRGFGSRGWLGFGSRGWW